MHTGLRCFRELVRIFVDDVKDQCSCVIFSTNRYVYVVGVLSGTKRVHRANYGYLLYNNR